MMSPLTPRLTASVPGLLLLLALAGLSGCELLGISSTPSEQGQPATTPVTKAPPARPPVLPPEESVLTEEEEAQKYKRPSYPGSVRRNPFQPVPGAIAPSVTVMETEQRPVDPAERYEIGQMQLVGLISETVVPKAMFVDPEGMGHILKEGDRIGRQGSVITDIRLNEVDIRETTGEDDSTQSAIRTLRLVDYEIASAAANQEDLSEAEKKALEALLKTEEGRSAVRESLRERVDRTAPQGGPGAPVPAEPGALLPPSARGGR